MSTDAPHKIQAPLISTVAFRDQTLFEAIPLAAGLGYPGIEIWEKHLTEPVGGGWSAIADALRLAGLSAPVVAPFLSFTRGPERVEASWKSAQNALAVASHLGSNRFRLFTDVGKDGVGSSDASEEQWQVAATEIRRLCRENPSMLFVLEIHPFTLADTPASTTRFLDAVGEANLRLNFQFIPTFLRDGWESELRKFFPTISHMHWHQVQADGVCGYLTDPGLLDFARVADWLAAMDYDGTISIEYCWPGADLARMRDDRVLLDRIESFARKS